MKPSLWLPSVDFRPAVRLRLVCFAHAGGGPVPFLRWASVMPEAVALCPICRPGRAGAASEPPLAEIGAIADGAFAALSTLPRRPTVLLGHSFGAAVAVEVARRMQAGGRGPELLVVTGKYPVHRPPPTPRIADLPAEAFIEALDATYGGIPTELREAPELLELLLPTLRADLCASEAYRPEPAPRLDCPIWVCHGVDDRALDPAELGAWAELSHAGARVEPYPGGHFFLFEDDTFVRSLVAELERLLARQSQ